MIGLECLRGSGERAPELWDVGGVGGHDTTWEQARLLKEQAERSTGERSRQVLRTSRARGRTARRNRSLQKKNWRRQRTTRKLGEGWENSLGSGRDCEELGEDRRARRGGEGEAAPRLPSDNVIKGT